MGSWEVVSHIRTPIALIKRICTDLFSEELGLDGEQDMERYIRLNPNHVTAAAILLNHRLTH
jgi:hypothetical protein